MEEFLFGLSWLILLLAPLLLAAQGGSQFMLLSPAFANGHSLHTKYANTGVQGGQNLSPPLAWHNPPDGTKSFALACVDRHPIARNWVHWLVINIPSDINVLGEGASGTAKMPARTKELNNTFGTVGWGGPQPPSGSGIHKYEFILYALNVENLDLGVNSKLEAFDKAIKGKVLAEVKLTGTYQR
jgi:Raf kinase inhibitor-like YbhB/YbcL family protein